MNATATAAKTTTATPADINAPTGQYLRIYPTVDELDYQEIYDAEGCFGQLLDWAKANGLSLRHDIESNETVTGYYVEDIDGRQIAAAVLSDRP